MSDDTRSSRVFDAWLLCVFIAGLGTLVASAQHSPVRLGAPVLVLLVATVVAESMPLSLSNEMTISVSHALTLAAAIVAGPTNAAIVSTFSAISLQDIEERRPLKIIAFNVGQLWLSTTIAGWGYVAAGGEVLGAGSRIYLPIEHVILPLTILAILMFVLNTSLVSVAGALKSGSRSYAVWQENYAWMIPSQFVFAMVALAIAQLLLVSMVGLVLAMVPLVIARQFYETYISRKAAYTQSVRSLVAAIEAKDAYTCGHSERVASLTRLIGERYGIRGKALESLELAALLHDIGKVGVSARILQKSGPLEEAERRVIADHPVAGARIAAEIGFLSSSDGVIRSHHERVDGTGYPDGLPDSTIPLGARILAVADSFDAMTSRRSYRRQMTIEEALEEIQRHAGSQFDEGVVGALLRIDLRTLASIAASAVRENRVARKAG